MPQVIISPAKQMRIDADSFPARGIPPFPDETARLHRALVDILHHEGPQGLQRLWSISDALLSSTLERLEEFDPILDVGDLDAASVARRVGPVVFAYVGLQYKSLAPEVLERDALAWLQKHLWVLSGLYGCVRPFDAVQPYRLEMGAKLRVDGTRNLYEFWGTRLAACVSHEANVIVNLASVEYAKAVLPHVHASIPLVTCIFGEELRDGKPVQRSGASKRARGSMVRWMAEQNVRTASELAAFDVGYAFAPELSTLDTPNLRDTMVFMKR